MKSNIEPINNASLIIGLNIAIFQQNFASSSMSNSLTRIQRNLVLNCQFLFIVIENLLQNSQINPFSINIYNLSKCLASTKFLEPPNTRQQMEKNGWSALNCRMQELIKK